MSNLDIIRGRSTVLNLTNQSGATRSPGDVVVIDTAHNDSFTTSASSNYTTSHIGVVDETIGISSNGRIVVEGYARAVKVSGTVTRGNFLYHSTTSATAIDGATAPPIAGAFASVLTGGSGTTPTALVFPTILSTGGSSASVSYASNSNDVSSAGAAGASTLVSRADHVHRGVTSIAVSSNTLTGPVTLVAQGSIGLTTNGQSIQVSSVGGSGGGGGGGGSGSLVFLEAHTASSSSSLDFTTFISSTYDTYLIEGSALVMATDNIDLRLQIGTGGGPTYDTASNYLSYRTAFGAAGTSNDAVSSGAGMRLFNGIDTGLTAHAYCAFSLTATNLQSTTYTKNFQGTTYFLDNSSNTLFSVWGGVWSTGGTAATALRFIASSGNIASGTIRIYGITKS